MSRTIRLHLDENCSGAIATGLKQLGIDVTTTPQARLLGASDEEQAEYALEEGRVIFTQDRDFLRIHASGASHAGIVYCDKDSRTVREILDALELLWEVLEPEDMRNHVEFI